MAKLNLKKGQTGNSHVVVSKRHIEHSTGAFGEIDFSAEEEFTLMHEEHGNIQLPKGYYTYISQREYDPLSRSFTEVFD